MNKIDYSVLDIIPQGVCIINRKLEVYFWNTTLEEWTGVKKSQILGKEIGAFFQNLKKPQYGSLLQKIVFDDFTPLIFSALLHKYFFYAHLDEKHHRIQHTTVKPIAATDNEEQRAMIFVQDVTELYTKIFELKKLRDGAIQEAEQHKLAKEKIKSLLAEKELILKEVHHRIKNNMNTMRELMILQADMMKDPIAITALNDASSRIQSMAILYDKLYRSENIEDFSIKEYLPSLVDEILGNFFIDTVVNTEKKIDDFILDVRRLQPIGIIINELLTNIMKYAFKGRETGLINIEVVLKPSTTAEGEHISIQIQDNGVGLPDSVDFDKSIGFGLRLVKMLTKQLGGTIRMERENGTRFILEFLK